MANGGGRRHDLCQPTGDVWPWESGRILTVAPLFLFFQLLQAPEDDLSGGAGGFCSTMESRSAVAGRGVASSSLSHDSSDPWIEFLSARVVLFYPA